MIKNILDRRTVRKYKNSEVSQTILDQILKAGMYAPYAAKEVPFHFIVIKNKKTLLEMKKLHPFGQPLETAPLAIMICADKKLEVADGIYASDCAAASQNILLAAKSFNLGSCWLGLFPWAPITENFHKHFNLPEEIVPFSIITLGYSNEEETPRPERFKPENLHYENW